MTSEFYYLLSLLSLITLMVAKNKKDLNCWSVQFELMIITRVEPSFEQTMKLDQARTNFGDDKML